MAVFPYYTNIALNATPTENNHLVPVSYLNEHFLSASVAAPAWVSGNVYGLGAVVVHNGQLYKSTITSNINIPSTLIGWQTTTLTAIADTDSYGIVKPDTSTININNGTISLKPATTSTLGGVIVGNGLAITDNGVCSSLFGRKKINYLFNGNVPLEDGVGVYCILPLSNTTIDITTSVLTLLSDYGIEFTLLLGQTATPVVYTFPQNFSWFDATPSFDIANAFHIVKVYSYNGGQDWFGEYKGSVSNNETVIYGRESLVKSTVDVSGTTIVLTDNETMYRKNLVGLDPVALTIDSSHLVPPTVSGTTLVISFDLYLTVGDNNPSITFTNNIVWLDFEKPIFMFAGTHILSFISYDGGTTWYGGDKGLV